MAFSARAKTPPPCGFCRTATTMTLAKGRVPVETLTVRFFWWKNKGFTPIVGSDEAQWNRGLAQIIPGPNQIIINFTYVEIKICN